MKRTFLLFVGLCLIIVDSVPANLTPVADYIGGGTLGNFSGTGFYFTINHDILVIAIGVYDHGGDGFATSHDVGLFLKSNYATLASGTLEQGTSGTYVPGTVDGTRFLSLEKPLLLTAGTSYYMLASNFSLDKYAFGENAVTYALSITWNGYVDIYTSDITGTPDFKTGLPGNLGPNFMFIPEPATVSLLALGGLVLLRKRK